MSEEPKVGENRGNAGKGRPPGSPNKTTAAVKEALNAVYADLQAKSAGDLEQAGEEPGEHAHLRTWASDNPTEFYKLWAKMLPTDLKAELAGSGELVINIKKYSGD